jgi:hypothetical protein
VGIRSAGCLLLVDGLQSIYQYSVAATQRIITKTQHNHTSGQKLTKCFGITNLDIQNIAISNNQQQYCNTATCLLRLVGCIVVVKCGDLLDTFVIVHPPTVRNWNVAVPSVRCSPVEHVFRFKDLRVERTFLEVQKPHLKRKYEEQETRYLTRTINGTRQQLFIKLYRLRSVSKTIK